MSNTQWHEGWQIQVQSSIPCKSDIMQHQKKRPSITQQRACRRTVLPLPPVPHVHKAFQQPEITNCKQPGVAHMSYRPAGAQRLARTIGRGRRSARRTRAHGCTAEHCVPTYQSASPPHMSYRPAGAQRLARTIGRGRRGARAAASAPAAAAARADTAAPQSTVYLPTSQPAHHTCRIGPQARSGLHAR